MDATGNESILRDSRKCTILCKNPGGGIEKMVTTSSGKSLSRRIAVAMRKQEPDPDGSVPRWTTRHHASKDDIARLLDKEHDAKLGILLFDDAKIAKSRPGHFMAGGYEQLSCLVHSFSLVPDDMILLSTSYDNLTEAGKDLCLGKGAEIPLVYSNDKRAKDSMLSSEIGLSYKHAYSYIRSQVPADVIESVKVKLVWSFLCDVIGRYVINPFEEGVSDDDERLAIYRDLDAAPQIMSFLTLGTIKLDWGEKTTSDAIAFNAYGTCQDDLSMLGNVSCDHPNSDRKIADVRSEIAWALETLDDHAAIWKQCLGDDSPYTDFINLDGYDGSFGKLEIGQLDSLWEEAERNGLSGKVNQYYEGLPIEKLIGHRKSKHWFLN
jgi:hypothetical protein